MAARRRSFTPVVRTTAHEFPNSVELEQRIVRIELAIQDIQLSMELQAKRTVAIQAQLDHFVARIRGV